MQNWQPTKQQLQQLETEGYFIVRNLIPRDAAMMIKGAILNHILVPEHGEKQGCESDPFAPGDTAMGELLAARFRKLPKFGITAPVVWYNYYTSSGLLDVARYFLGDDLVLKFNSCFLKPARTGASTPWHQDNGLWRDQEVEPLNFWTAIDPAVRENGCMQFVPGSHKEPIHGHIEYPDMKVHAEIPREVVRDSIRKYGLHHIELMPGDTAFWHSNLFHFSPDNTSENSRIAVAGVFSKPSTSLQNKFHQNHVWAMRNGKAARNFPPEPLTGYSHPIQPLPVNEKRPLPAMAA
jgi:ectoine hydroxylase-related dioxygenase (phytanoyl-CoA dioxygenase family)